MTDPRLLAEKIAETLRGDDTQIDVEGVKSIESLLKEALDGAWEEGAVNENERHGNVDYLKEIRLAAYEDACRTITKHKYREFTEEERHGACGGFCPHGCFVDDHECRKCLCEAIRLRASELK